MPIYTFENTETEEQFDMMMAIADKEKWLKKNPHMKQIVLSRVAEANPYSPMADDFGKKDAKSVKIRDTVKKVKKRVGNLMGESKPDNV